MARFYFAFVEPTDTIFNNAFKRNDADVFSFELSHQEGQFATLDIEIKNPKVGLLAQSRKQWCWLSYENGQTFSELFFGRIVGVPEDIDKEIVKLTFVARPSDFESQKLQIAETQKVFPYYDKVWIEKSKWNDPDSILEAQSKLWHIDRASHIVSLTDYNSGEDQAINLGTDFFYDSLNINYTSPPLYKIEVEADVSWTETVSGSFDIASKFPLIRTLTGPGLIGDWPDYGTDLKGGWSFGLTKAKTRFAVNLPNFVIFYDWNSKNIVRFNVYEIKVLSQEILYNSERDRKETIKFTLQSDVQEIFSNIGDEAIERINLSSDQIDEILDENNNPIINNVYRTFFKTSRGKQSLDYLIAIAKAKLMTRARAVEVSGESKFENGLNFSCRKDILLEDTRLPSGACVGKIKSYSLFADGNSGNLGCKFQIGCTIGTGSSTVVSSGTPSYVNSGYVVNYQFYTGAQFEALVGGAVYNDFSNLPINDDGLDFSNYTLSQAFNSLTINNRLTQQYNKVRDDVIPFYQGGTNTNATTELFKELISKYPTEINLKLNPISEGPFETTYDITVSKLNIPKTIDLEI